MPENSPIKPVGLLLKETRESRGISLESASKATRVHISILKKIEADDFVSIGAVYAKGFLKIYAEFLGVDKDYIMERYVHGSDQTQRPRAAQRIIIPAAPQAKAKGSAKVLGGVWGVLKKFDVRILVILVLCLLFILGVRMIAKAVGRRNTGSKSAAAVSSPAVAKKTVAAVSKKRSDAPVEKESKVSSVASQKVVLVVRAKSKTWLGVKVDGRVVFQNVLAKGVAESWTADKKIELTIGNAGAVELELNGRILEKIGRPGQALKRVIVTREGLSVEK